MPGCNALLLKKKKTIKNKNLNQYQQVIKGEA